MGSESFCVWPVGLSSFGPRTFSILSVAKLELDPFHDGSEERFQGFNAAGSENGENELCNRDKSNVLRGRWQTCKPIGVAIEFGDPTAARS